MLHIRCVCSVPAAVCMGFVHHSLSQVDSGPLNLLQAQLVMILAHP